MRAHLFAVLSVLVSASVTLDPKQTLQSIDTVEKAIKQVIGHVTPLQMSSSKTELASLQRIVNELENGENLTKAGRMEKVAHAMEVLQHLQKEWQAVANNMTAAMNSTDHKIEATAKTLAEKEKLLAKEEALLKEKMLEKELLEKKIQLEKLLAEKESLESQKHTSKDAEQQEQQNAMVSQLVGMAKSLVKKRKAAPHAEHEHTQGATAVDPAVAAKLAPILANLEAQIKTKQAKIDEIKAEEAKQDAGLTHAVPQLPGSKDSEAKAQNMLKMIKKEVHRKLEKAVLVREAQVADLKAAVKAIHEGDVATLMKVLEKSQKEAKKHNFIY